MKESNLHQLNEQNNPDQDDKDRASHDMQHHNKLQFNQDSQCFTMLQAPYYLIQEGWEVEQLSKAIMDALDTKHTPILGVDCEGLAKNRKM